jgi:6-phosphogluconolactonase (cycloisomerase 2 family)
MYSNVSRPLSFTTLRALALAACASGLLVACNSALDSAGSTISTGAGSGNGSIGGNGTASSSGGGTQTSYTIGGTVIGFSGTGLVLANNAGNNLTITGNGGFTFSNQAASGATYKVTITAQPLNPSQVCTVMNGVGTVGTVNVASVTVSCTTNFYNVGGSVTGLTGSGLVLQTNGTNNVSVSAPGNYVFSTLASGSNYAVTVMTQPSNPSQTCTVANDTGQLTNANVTNVAITCTTNNYAISGSVSGLNGAGLVLQTNGANPVPIAGSGSYTFATLPSGSAYAITVMTAPGNPSQTCAVGNGTGTVVSADVTNVSITCTTNLYTVGGTVTGLSGTALMLQDNGGDNLTVAANGSFTFGTKIASNMTYAVTVGTAPTNPAQLCRVTGGTGTVTTANVTTVAIHCTNTGRFVFLANPFDNNGNGTVAAFRINPLTGALTAAAGSPYIPVELQPYALALDPNGQFLYVANSGSNIVSTYGIGAGGALALDVSTAITGTPTNFPHSLAVDPTGPYLYVGSDDTINGTLEAFSINAGVLTPVTGVLGTSTYPAGNVPFGLAVDPVNALLYASNYYDATLVGDSVGAPGTLTAVPGSPFGFQGGVLVNQPFGIAIYPTGGFMYITDSVGNTVTEYGYGANGVLTQGVSYAVGLAPKGVTIDPTGSFLYVSNSGDGTVSAFTVNTDGTLTAVAGSPFVSTTTNVPSAATPTAVQVDPSGQFAYVANGDDGTVTIFRINLTTGALTQVGAKVQTFMVGGGGGPSSVAIE